jgi:RND family efflux transporter MFP subunit
VRIAQRFSVGLHAGEGRVPKGRLSGLRTGAISAVPSGLGSVVAGSPTLKRWAIIAYPFGISLLLGLLLSGLVAFVAGCGTKREPPGAGGESLPPAAVRVQKIETVKQPAVEEVVGTVQPKLQAVIEAKVSGRITRLAVTVGQSVKQGDVLVELATQEIQAKLDQASAAFRQAELDFNRVSNLRKQEAATQAEFDAAQARYHVAKAGVAEADALSGYAKIRAPFDGVIARKLADEGDLAMPGKPLLALEGRTGLRLVADVPSLLASRVEPGAKLAVRVDTVPDPILGTVAEIAPAADPASRTVNVKVDLPDAPGLRSGQFGRLAVPVGEGTFLFVPPPALVVRGQLEILFVAADGKAQMRLVRAGKQTEQGIEILSGLAPGESVVVEGAGLLRDGQPIQSQ